MKFVFTLLALSVAISQGAFAEPAVPYKRGDRGIHLLCDVKALPLHTKVDYLTVETQYGDDAPSFGFFSSSKKRLSAYTDFAQNFCADMTEWDDSKVKKNKMTWGCIGSKVEAKNTYMLEVQYTDKTFTKVASSTITINGHVYPVKCSRSGPIIMNP